jgi:monofunctional biosynthetic peptidoglycan transglycosylase
VRRTPKRKRASRLRGLALRAAGVLALGLAVAGAVVVLTWPDVDAVAAGRVETSAFMVRYRERTGRAPRFRWAAYDQISEPMKLAVLVAEDARFFRHQGFDVEELTDAVLDRLREDKRMRGASTLTQQLAKNLWLSGARSPGRKVKEAILAAQLERSLSKRRILELYLNVAELGPGIFGVEAAAQRYYGIGAADLDADQAAHLAAGLSRPSAWHPGAKSPRYAQRVQHILQEMTRAAWLTRDL